MTEERQKMIENRGCEIVEEECQKRGIENFSQFVGISAQVWFSRLENSLEDTFSVLEIDLPNAKERQLIRRTIIDIIYRYYHDLEVISLQDPIDE